MHKFILSLVNVVSNNPNLIYLSRLEGIIPRYRGGGGLGSVGILQAPRYSSDMTAPGNSNQIFKRSKLVFCGVCSSLVCMITFSMRSSLLNWEKHTDITPNTSWKSDLEGGPAIDSHGHTPSPELTTSTPTAHQGDDSGKLNPGVYLGECGSNECDAAIQLANSRNHFPGRPLMACVHFQSQRGFCLAPLENSSRVAGMIRGTLPPADLRITNIFFADLVMKLPESTEGSCIFSVGDGGNFFSDAEIDYFWNARIPVLAHNIRGRSSWNFIFIPDCHFANSRGFQQIISDIRRNEVPFDQKKPSIFWRGTTTGSSKECRMRQENRTQGDTDPCESLLRTALVRKSLPFEHVDAKLSKASQCCVGYEDRLAKDKLLSPRVSQVHWPEHRGIFDVDGNANAFGMFWRLASGSTVFRVMDDDPWNNYYLNLTKPWVHYIPVKSDLSDFKNVTAIVASEDPDDLHFMELVANRSRSLALSVTYTSSVQNVAAKLRNVWNT